MKQLNSYLDMAVFGAKPAYEQPLHVGRPNIGSQQAFLEYTNDIFERRWLSNNGPLVQQLEKRISEFLSVKHCVVMCNGTIALEIAIRALELTGEVIVPSYTFIATAHALQWQEITPVFADIDPDTHTLDAKAVRRMITPRTTGIIGVHIWGRSAPVDELDEIAKEFGLKLMFDAAHAFGCSYKGKMIGNFGECEVLSFHATKLFNTFEGGAVLTNNDELARKMRLMKNFGFSGYDNVIYPGTNGKMTEIAAAMGLVNLDSLSQFIEKNYQNYIEYKNNFKDIKGIKIINYDENELNNYQYVVVEIMDDFPIERDMICRIFHEENILVRKYFWPGCHNMQPYRSYYPHAGILLENTIKIANRVIVLPTGTTIDNEHIKTIANIFAIISKSGKQLEKIKIN